MSERPLFRRIRIRDDQTGEVRIIQGGDIAHCSSPVAPLFESITRCVAQIVPERHNDLLALVESGIFFEIDGVAQHFYIAADVKGKKVILGLAALERIWAYTYFYLALDDVLTKRGRGQYIDLTSIPEIQPARHLAIWAQQCEESKSQKPWPEGLPRPGIENSSDARVELARHYFLHALCFLALHEIGHIYWKHPIDEYAPGESHKWELQADKWAADFMLEHWQHAGRGDIEFSRRYTGIVLGLAVLASVELHHYEAVDDHPTIAWRLLTLFDARHPQSVGAPSPERDFPVHFVSAIIHAHLMNAKILLDLSQEYDDIMAYLVAAHRLMSEHKDR